LHVAAPRDGQRLKETLREALDISDAPSLIRFPKGAINPDIPAFERRDGIDVLYRGESADVLLVSIGAFASIAVESAAQAYREGVGVTVIDPRWVKPLPKALITMAQRYKNVVVLEDGIKHGGIASTISELFREEQLNIPVHSIGLPLTFLEHAKRAQILEDLGITVQNITRSLVSWNSTQFAVDAKEEMPLPLDESERRKPLR
jgi:1-deoxy-D-xylulose-5-phosphate synthase